MKAIVISTYGGPEVLTVTELPDPVPADGEVLIRVKAFGLNHAEAYMRSGAWGEVAPVPGIECAGTVRGRPRAGGCPPGRPWSRILGGMGRTRNGSYAELVTVPASNVVPVQHVAVVDRPGRGARGVRDRVGRAAPQPGPASPARPCWSAGPPPRSARPRSTSRPSTARP